MGIVSREIREESQVWGCTCSEKVPNNFQDTCKIIFPSVQLLTYRKNSLSLTRMLYTALKSFSFQQRARDLLRLRSGPHYRNLCWIGFDEQTVRERANSDDGKDDADLRQHCRKISPCPVHWHLEPVPGKELSLYLIAQKSGFLPLAAYFNVLSSVTGKQDR